MHKVLTAAQMRRVDRLTTERYGIPSLILMENAAHAVARVITDKLGGSVKDKSILILCGKGNNGGDGAALARILWTQGAYVQIILLGTLKETNGDARENLEICLALVRENEDRISLREIDNPFELWSLLSSQPNYGWDCLVDALFGTGLTRPLEDPLAEVIESINHRQYLAENCLIVSVDIPSGLESDSAELIGAPFDADITVAFTAPKIANILPPSSNWNGELMVSAIGSPDELIEEQESQIFLAEDCDAAAWLTNSEFYTDSYKNKRGHALVIAGSETYSGAAVLSSNSAIRSGVGLVTLACPAEAKT
ncbi:MAG: NAD(P)H-hydrate epimerase, partial [Pyrinomonadaceae bacterium]